MRSFPTAHDNDYINFASLASMFALNGFLTIFWKSYFMACLVHITHISFYETKKVMVQLPSECLVLYLSELMGRNDKDKDGSFKDVKAISATVSGST